MRLEGRRARFSVLATPVVTLLLVAFSVLPGDVVRAQSQVPYTKGVPWDGGPGKRESVAEIMSRDRGASADPPKEGPRHRVRNQAKTQNPDSPQASQWPVRPLSQATREPEPATPQTLGTSFLGAQYSESGFVPPDSMGDVGPTQILVAVNGRIKVFDKSGTVGGLNATLENFFSSVGGVTNGTSDPHVRYDRLTGRWFVTAISIDQINDILIAVSTGSTITSSSSFTFFKFQHDQVGGGSADNGKFADYDTLGVDKFALYVGVNVFNTNNTFFNTSVYVIDKADLIAATPSLTVTAFRQLITDLACTSGGGGPYTPQGVNNDDPSATQGYFVGVDWCLFGELVTRRVIDPGGTPLLSGNLDLTVPTTTFPQDQPQPPPGPNLDAIDDRLFAAAIHKNKISGGSTLWTAHNIEVNSSGIASSSGNRNGSRWYEIASLTGTPTLVQSGTLFDPSATKPFGYWMPSVAMSGQGHMALGSSRASANKSTGYASIAAAGRLRTDSLGTTESPTLVQPSSFLYNGPGSAPERWGDYSQVGIDPIDDMTMWTFQEYASATNSWGVRVIQLKAPPPATPSSASPSTVAAGQASVSVVVTGTSLAGSEFFDPGPDIGGPGYPNHLTATVTGGVTVNSATFNSPTQVTLDISTVGASGGTQEVTIVNPDGQSRAGPILTISAGGVIIDQTDGLTAVSETGPTSDTYTLALATAPTSTVTVTPTATPADDVTVAPSSVVFPAGDQGPKTVTVTAVDDFIDETSPHLATISHAAASSDPDYNGIFIADVTVNVTDNDTAGITIVESGGSTNVTEGGATDTYTVALDTQPTASVTVTPTPDSQVTASPSSLTFTSGNWSSPQTVTVTAVDDSAIEGSHTGIVGHIVSSADPFYNGISVPEVTVTITDNDTVLKFSSSSYSVNEGAGSATITVVRIGTTDSTVGVSYSTSNGTATAGSDYTASSGTLSFGSGVISKTFAVPITNDTSPEANETVNLALSSPTGGAVLGSPSSAVLTILDNDPQLKFSNSSYSANESAGNATITVSRVGGQSLTVGTSYSTANGTAVAGFDYTASSGTLTFSSGQTSKTFSVPITGDPRPEAAETVNLILNNPTGGAVLGSPSSAVLTIIDDDPASPHGYWILESNGGVHARGGAGFFGSAAGVVPSGAVDIAGTTTGGGYWIAENNGGVHARGDAGFFGGAFGVVPSGVVGIVAHPANCGYWIAESNGGIHARGCAGFFGNAFGVAPSGVVAIAATPTGAGYWIFEANGGVHARGDAGFFGSASGFVPSGSTGADNTLTAGGYWITENNGGVHARGDAGFFGAAFGVVPSGVQGISGTPDNGGYWIVETNGGVHARGDAEFLGGAFGVTASPVVDIEGRFS